MDEETKKNAVQAVVDFLCGLQKNWVVVFAIACMTVTAVGVSAAALYYKVDGAKDICIALGAGNIGAIGGWLGREVYGALTNKNKDTTTAQ